MRQKSSTRVAVAFTWGALALAAVIGSASQSQAQDSLLLRDRENAIFRSGMATTEPPDGQQPQACTNLGVTCAQFDLTIDLPHNTWERSGGVQVAIRWATDDNALDLFVYQHNAQSGADIQVGNSSGILAGISDSLLLRSAANGTYKVYVALDPSNSSDVLASFEAEARVQYDPNISPVRPSCPISSFGHKRPSRSIRHSSAETVLVGLMREPIRLPSPASWMSTITCRAATRIATL